jgi:membrane associated rhomboid family serine protease
VIPLFDIIPRRQRPYVTLSLVAAQFVAFAVQRIALDVPAASFDYGAIPARLQWTSILTATFVHDSPAHVGLNMLLLWLFGPTVEDRTGHGRFLALYALGAAATVLAHATVHAHSMLPFVGTSGAVAAVLGAYVVLYPRSQVLLLIPMPGLPIVELPAPLIAGMWVAVQILTGWTTATMSGLLVGAALVLLFRRRERMAVGWWDSRPERPFG